MVVTTLVFHGDDLHELFDTLVEAVKVTLRDEARPAIEVNGKLFEPHELFKVAALLPLDEELRLQHQAIANHMFDRRQYGYGRTMISLAHLANQIASAAAWRDADRSARRWLAEAARTQSEWSRRGEHIRPA